MRNRSIAASLAAPLAAALLAATPIPAAADTQGFLVGLTAGTNHIDSTDETAEAAPGTIFIDENGGGANLHLGWGFTRSFALRLSVGAATHETTDSEVDVVYSSSIVEGQYLFRDPDALRPYVLGGVGGMWARSRRGDLEFETSGPGLVFGTGMIWFPAPNFFLDFGGRADFVNWDEQKATVTVGGVESTVTEPVEKDGFAARLAFGAGWWF